MLIFLMYFINKNVLGENSIILLEYIVDLYINDCTNMLIYLSNKEKKVVYQNKLYKDLHNLIRKE